MKTRGVRVVRAEGMRRPWDVNVFDLESGEKLTDIYRVHFDVSAEVARIEIVSGAPWVYEGPADIFAPEETDIGYAGRRSRDELIELAGQYTEAARRILDAVAGLPVDDAEDGA